MEKTMITQKIIPLAFVLLLIATTSIFSKPTGVTTDTGDIAGVLMSPDQVKDAIHNLIATKNTDEITALAYQLYYSIKLNTLQIAAVDIDLPKDIMRATSLAAADIGIDDQKNPSQAYIKVINGINDAVRAMLPSLITENHQISPRSTYQQGMLNMQLFYIDLFMDFINNCKTNNISIANQKITKGPDAILGLTFQSIYKALDERQPFVNISPTAQDNAYNYFRDQSLKDLQEFEQSDACKGKAINDNCDYFKVTIKDCKKGTEFCAVEKTNTKIKGECKEIIFPFFAPQNAPQIKRFLCQSNMVNG